MGLGYTQTCDICECNNCTHHKSDQLSGIQLYLQYLYLKFTGLSEIPGVIVLTRYF